MKRRKFLEYSGIGLTGVSMQDRVFHPNTDKSEMIAQSADVIVIGAGTFGMWTAFHLLSKGAKVTLIDAYGPGNSRASSGGETRLIQTDTDDALYVRSAIRSFELWKQLETESGEQLVLPTGRLAMAKEDKYLKYAVERQKQLAGQGIHNTEVLSQDEMKYRWPQIFVDDISVGLYNHGGPSGSTLMARRGIQEVAQLFQKKGGRLVIARARPSRYNGKVDGITINNGEVLKAQSYVFACGPWLPKIFPELLFRKLQVQRRDVIFVGIPSGDERFSYPNLPEWSVYGSGYYGFPDIEGRGLKVAPYPDLNSFDPDQDERLISHYQVKRAHDFVANRFPAMKGQPVIESRVCQVTNSIDGNFIVDRHPDSDNTWVIGGGSGHGFKHGPATGEFAAKYILGENIDQSVRDQFKLKEQTF